LTVETKTRGPRTDFSPNGEVDSPSQSEHRVKEVALAGLRGAIAAMAMTGMRRLTVNLGIVKQPPPEMILKEKAPGLIARVPKGRRVAAIELAHWTYGAGGGAVFGMLPEEFRRRAWAGPIYGLMVWVGFELGIAPVLGLRSAKEPMPAQRAALAADHLLYGLVLSEIRRRPQG
jgi:hypothetical protein